MFIVSNRFIMKKESNIQFWNVFSGDITYKSTGNSGKSCRLNMFASTSKQINDWKSALKTGYIGTEHDLKNQEVTIVMRLRKRVGQKTECSSCNLAGEHIRIRAWHTGFQRSRFCWNMRALQAYALMS